MSGCRALAAIGRAPQQQQRVLLPCLVGRLCQLTQVTGGRIRAAMVRNRWLVMDLAGWAGYRNQETADSQAAMVALPLALATLNSSPEATLGPP